MGAISFDDEYTSAVAPHRLFQALYADAHNFMPKILPSVKSIEILSGDGGPGSIQQINYTVDGPVKYLKQKVDSKDEDNLVCKYTVFECDAFGDKIDSIANEMRFEDGPNGGSIVKTKRTYHPKGDTVLNEEEIKARIERSKENYKVIETYLVENPEIYA